ncbi:hypothetical protein CONLIGDRAFT_635367 [Coniochaeta ligniaria NRRL 30616]|uniref:Uncharacterized protein n=1 Tax=Coniochaeta ligniaria NRRL 30616 TaxID=1408157 RepID=A0A1J7JD81_9PEZI|nr:hypothetical protein CONLIGDRAFT_635367 [Coniochaeta ligniaria NRRL 30616]
MSRHQRTSQGPVLGRCLFSSGTLHGAALKQPLTQQLVTPHPLPCFQACSSPLAEAPSQLVGRCGRSGRAAYIAPLTFVPPHRGTRTLRKLPLWQDGPAIRLVCITSTTHHQARNF